MDLRTYLNSITQPEREALAKNCETSVDYFWQLSGGHRKAGHNLAKRIEKYTDGKVTKHELRPDIFDASEMDAA